MEDLHNLLSKFRKLPEVKQSLVPGQNEFFGASKADFKKNIYKMVWIKGIAVCIYLHIWVHLHAQQYDNNKNVKKSEYVVPSWIM